MHCCFRVHYTECIVQKNKVKKSQDYIQVGVQTIKYTTKMFVFLNKFRKTPVIATRRQLTAADMASTQVPFAVSDLVTFRGHTCIILEIRREHGFHTYQLRDLDTGVIARAFRYELKPANATEDNERHALQLQWIHQYPCQYKLAPPWTTVLAVCGHIERQRVQGCKWCPGWIPEGLKAARTGHNET